MYNIYLFSKKEVFMAQAPGSSGSIPPKVFDLASGSNSNTVNEGDAAVAAVARRAFAEAPEVQPTGGAGRAPANSELTDALLKAANQGDVEEVRSLLKRGADANAVNRCGYTTLMVAAMQGHAVVVEALLEEGVDPNTVGEGGCTALMRAAVWGRVGAVEALLKRGADPNVVNNNGYTALMEIVEWVAHTEVVEALLRGGADPNIVNENIGTALIGAASKGPEFVEALLRGGADPNAVNKGGYTALMGAVQEGDVEVIKMLLAAGANPDAVNKGGYTALMEAVQERDVEVVDFDGDIVFVKAVREGLTEVVEAFLEGGADPLVVDSKGRMAIQMVEGDPDETREILAMLSSAEEQWKRKRNVAALFATLVPGMGKSMLH